MGKKGAKTRNLDEVRREFERKGLSVAAWARENGLSRGLVYSVLNGRVAGRIGQSHKVAVLLGIKDGEITG